MKELKQSSTSYPITFLLVQSADHVTPLTGATPTVTLSKNGASFGAAAGAVTEIGNGWYALAGNATDRNTLGSLLVHITAASADPNDDRYYIVPWDPFDANLALSNLDAAISTRSTYAGADTSGTTTLLSRLSSGRATNLDNLDAAITTRSTYAGTDTSGTTTLLSRLTGTRAGLLDNLDAAISTRSTYAGADTPGTGTLLSRVASTLTITGGKVDVNDKTGFSLSSAGIQAIWDALTSALTTAGSIGKKIVDGLNDLYSGVTDTLNMASNAVTAIGTTNSRLTATRAGYLDNLTRLDVAVSSVAYSGADTPGTTTLLSRLTGTRAGYLDNLTNLDASVSSRSTYAGGAVASVTAPVTVGTNNDKSDYYLSEIEEGIIAEQVQLRMDAVSTKLAHLDANVSSRSTYAGADTPGTTTLLARLTSQRAVYLDNLVNLDTTVSSRSTFNYLTNQVTVGTNNDKTGYTLSSSYTSLIITPGYTPPPNLTQPTGLNYWQP